MAVTAVLATLAAAGSVLALSASAATNTPPWEPDVNAIGTLTFYNSAGQQVTSGSDLSHLFDYALASTTDPFSGTKATLEFSAPVPNTPTGNFTTAIVSASTNFPNASAPVPLNTSLNPLVTLASSDANLEAFIQANQAQTAPGFANVWQIRVVTSGPGGVGTVNNSGQYWDADVMVDPIAGTWTEVYPEQGSTTQTTNTVLSVSPLTKAPQGSPVTLTAQTSASDATNPAGSVEFFQDGFSLGKSDVNSSGMANLTTSALLPSAPAGTTLTATFTPSAAGYTPSNSNSVLYEVDPVATVPTLSGPHRVGAKETCTEGTGSLDFGVVASYTWKVNTTTTIGTGSSIVLPGSSYKKSLTCTVSVHDGNGPSSSATSLPVTVSLGAALKATKPPTLSGTHRVGRLETVHPGTWSQKNARFTYQWLLNGRVIRGATHTTLRLTRAERGKRISCRVTAHLAGFANGVATTASVRVTS